MIVKGVLRTTLVVLWCILVLPLHAFHELTEEHQTTVHHCEESSCISKFDPECDICLFPRAVYTKIVTGHQSFIPFSLSYLLGYESFDIPRIISEFPKNKAPPVYYLPTYIS